MSAAVAAREVTRLLEGASAGDEQSSAELWALVYTELRRRARICLSRERPGQTLQPTALVHEVYLRLLGDQEPHWANRAHFFTAAAEAMRRILIERARAKATRKRGGGWQRVTWTDAAGRCEPRPAELLALDEALDRLANEDPTMARVVELRYFAGLTVDETAKALGVSPRSVNRHWTAARAWLEVEIEAGSHPSA